MIPLTEPTLDGNEARYLQECVTSGFVSSVGPFVTRLEQMVATATGADQAVAVSSGTAGLLVSLVALGVRPGDLVIVPSLTFIASANAVSHAGADPWLMDVAPRGWALDPDLLARELADKTRQLGGVCVHRASGRRVAAVLPVHMLGMPADMDRIVAIARCHNLAVLADGAAAIGATRRGQPLGRMGADLTVLSFNGNKIVTSGAGGAVVGTADTVAEVRHLSTTARVGPEYRHDRVGYNFRMSNLQAAVGCAQMERLAALVDAKRRIAADYDAALADIAACVPFAAPDDTVGSCWLSGFLLAEDAPLTAEQLRHDLCGCGIDARPFWIPVHQQEPYQDALRTPMPTTDAVWSRIVTLPCSPGLSAEDQRHVVDSVRTLLGSRPR